MRRLLTTPAWERLEWILEGLDASTDWGADASEVLAPEFTRLFSARSYVELTRRRAVRFSPVIIVGVEITEHTAKARLRDNTGEIWVLHVAVEPEPPHRIVLTALPKLVPEELTPRLPMDFIDYPLEPGPEPTQLVVFSGLPGSGKSHLADAVGREMRVPVFAVDWLLGALSPFGLRHLDGLVEIGDELLTTLALRQLAHGQSAILDSPVEAPGTRQRWRSLADRAGADFVAVMCECPDPQVHRERVEGRMRAIPGWHDEGEWNNVTSRRATFPPWPDDVLTIDTTQPNDANVAAVLDHVRRRSARGAAARD